MLLTNDEYEVRFNELQKIKIHLDEDPIAHGLTSINKKISEIQAQKDRVSAILLEAIKNKTEATLLAEASKHEYDQKLNELLATDVEVQNQKSEKNRNAVANTKIPELVLKVHYAERDLAVAEAYYKCVQQIYTNLESVNSNLSRQISVIQMGLQVGDIDKEDLKGLFGKQITIKGEIKNV